jgi:CheY-like chemotaxis protein
MTFPLYRRPGAVAFLDDDPDYLEMLAEVMPRDWSVKLFTDPPHCIGHLQQEPARWEADAWRQHDMIDRSRNGQPLISQILDYWKGDGTSRFDLTRVLVVDYSMPALNGLQVLDTLADWPGSRILLTGQADEQIAVKAFNQGLIDQFIPKQSVDITRRLTDAIKRLLELPTRGHNQIWRATLTREQYALLCAPSIAPLLNALVARQRWIEHVVIGAPFGVLGLDAVGQASWIQLEHRDNLRDLAELAWSQGLPPADVEDVRTGKKLVDLELQLALNSGITARLAPAVALGDDIPLWAAIFTLDAALCPGPAMAYAAYLAAQGERALPD